MTGQKLRELVEPHLLRQAVTRDPARTADASTSTIKPQTVPQNKGLGHSRMGYGSALLTNDSAALAPDSAARREASAR
jgi:hypothetical protein